MESQHMGQGALRGARGTAEGRHSCSSAAALASAAAGLRAMRLQCSSGDASLEDSPQDSDADCLPEGPDPACAPSAAAVTDPDDLSWATVLLVLPGGAGRGQLLRSVLSTGVRMAVLSPQGPTAWALHLIRPSDWVTPLGSDADLDSYGPGWPPASLLPVAAMLTAPLPADAPSVEAALRGLRAWLQRPGAPSRLDGVLCYDEYGIELAAALAEHLGLPGPPTASLALARDKARFRQRCVDAGLPAPRFVAFDALHLPLPREEGEGGAPGGAGGAGAEGALERRLAELLAGAGVRLPAVVKPTKGAGSLYASLVTRPEQLAAAVRRFASDLEAKRRGGVTMHSGLLVEEVIYGQEVDVDIVVHNGSVLFASVSDNHPPLPPWMVERGGCCPSALPPHAVRELQVLSQRVMTALGDPRWLQQQRQQQAAQRKPGPQEAEARVQRQLAEVLALLPGGPAGRGAAAVSAGLPAAGLSGCMHFEAFWSEEGGAVPIELNARIGGAETFECVRSAWGVDLGLQALYMCLGLPPPILRLPRLAAPDPASAPATAWEGGAPTVVVAAEAGGASWLPQGRAPHSPTHSMGASTEGSDLESTPYCSSCEIDLPQARLSCSTHTGPGSKCGSSGCTHSRSSSGGSAGAVHGHSHSRSHHGHGCHGTLPLALPLRTYVHSTNMQPAGWAGGRGVLKALHTDLDALRADPALASMHLFFRPGDTVALPPDGFAYMGWLVAKGPTPQDAERELRRLEASLRFEMAPGPPPAPA